MKIGIFGGSFDPCHCGHHAIVKKVLDDQFVDKVVILPSVVGYYRTGKTPLFNHDERKKILHAFFDEMDNVILDFYEYSTSDEARASRRYIDMLRDTKSRYYSEDKVEFFTIVGGDSLCNFKTWHNWQSILAESKLISVSRDGYACDSDIPHIKCRIDDKFGSISATKIRERLNGASQFTFCPESDIYIEDEVKPYLATGKTYDELKEENAETIRKAICYMENSKMQTNALREKLEEVQRWLNDPYKDDICKWSLIADLVRGYV